MSKTLFGDGIFFDKSGNSRLFCYLEFLEVIAISIVNIDIITFLFRLFYLFLTLLQISHGYYSSLMPCLFCLAMFSFSWPYIFLDLSYKFCMKWMSCEIFCSIKSNRLWLSNMVPHFFGNIVEGVSVAYPFFTKRSQKCFINHKYSNLHGTKDTCQNTSFFHKVENNTSKC